MKHWNSSNERFSATKLGYHESPLYGAPGAKLRRLRRHCGVIEHHRLVQRQCRRHMLDLTKEEKLSELLAEIDMILQYFESVDYCDPESAEVADEQEDSVHSVVLTTK